MKADTFSHNGTHILYDRHVFDNVEDISFDSQSWAQRASIIGFAEGRGTTFFVQYKSLELVLRHYKRGGLISRWLEDEYFWFGLRLSRPWREWRLLQWMNDAGLPVPQPVAAQVKRKGIFYTADIITRRIPHARSLSGYLQKEPLSEGYWIALGSLLRRFHEQGVYHADLNANNILLDDGGRFYLVDFDKCHKRKPAAKWQRANLLRLKRSLMKFKNSVLDFQFNDESWANLLRGYGWPDLEVSSR